jgi:hypothetical protein
VGNDVVAGAWHDENGGAGSVVEATELFGGAALNECGGVVKRAPPSAFEREKVDGNG